MICCCCFQRGAVATFVAFRPNARSCNFRARIRTPLCHRLDQRRVDGRRIHLYAVGDSATDRRRCDDDAVPPQRDDRFLRQVEKTVERVLQKYCADGIDVLNDKDEDDSILLSLPSSEREAVGVVRHLHQRLQAATTNHDCRRCWLQQAHCICDQILPLPVPLCVNRIFLLTHHKEICLAVDTAKLILAAFPESSRLVVGGIPADFQESMKEMVEAASSEKTLLLFPAEGAQTFAELLSVIKNEGSTTNRNSEEAITFDLIVIDGTWEQARRLHQRYFPSRPARLVQLSPASLNSFYADSNDPTFPGRQLRRHPIPVREISTVHALHLLLQDMVAVTSNGEELPRYYDIFGRYQQIASAGALAQLGPLRRKQS